MIAYHVEHAAELWSADPQSAGPTGDFVEVLEGQVQDAGGNILFAGSAGDCVKRKWRVPVTLVPTKWRKIDGELAGCDHQWQLVTR